MLLPSVRFCHDFMGELCPECQASRRWRAGSYLQTRFRGARCGLQFPNCYFRGSGNPDGRGAYKPPRRGLGTMETVKPSSTGWRESIQENTRCGEEGRRRKSGVPNGTCDRKSDFLHELTWRRRAPFLFARRISATYNFSGLLAPPFYFSSRLLATSWFCYVKPLGRVIRSTFRVIWNPPQASSRSR